VFYANNLAQRMNEVTESAGSIGGIMMTGEV
jgi:hypothetical protein